MKLYMEYQKDGWTVKQDLELPNDEKLAARILTSVRKYQADKEKKAAQVEQKAEAETIAEKIQEEIEQPEQPKEPEQQKIEGYSGNLICECDGCHKIKAFHTNFQLKDYKCNECGVKTELHGMADVKVWCSSCREAWKYQTNVMDGSVEVACPKCGKPLTAWWNSKEKVYEN